MRFRILIIAIAWMIALAGSAYADNDGNGNNGREHVEATVYYQGSVVTKATVTATCQDGTENSGSTNNNGWANIPIDCQINNTVEVKATAPNGATATVTGMIEEPTNGNKGETQVYIYIEDTGADLPEYPAGILSVIMSIVGIGLAGRKTMF